MNNKQKIMFKLHVVCSSNEKCIIKMDNLIYLFKK